MRATLRPVRRARKIQRILWVVIILLVALGTVSYLALPFVYY